MLVAAAALAVAAAACSVGARDTAPSPAPSPKADPSAHLTRAQRKAIFARSIKRENTAEVVTGDLTAFAGTRVRYDCDVDEIVGPHTILGQCGPDVEPVDLFIDMPAMKLRKGDRWRILGTLEQPVPWTDVHGHTVYYAFVQAAFVDPAPPAPTAPPILYR
jgi:hypothetical protein